MKIDYRTLNYSDTDELRRYLTIFYRILADVDEYYVTRSSKFIEHCVEKARRDEDVTNTFSGIALEEDDIVGLHILRRFEEGNLIGAHIAGLWVAEPYRGRGVARILKTSGEDWARSIGAKFLNTNVQVGNVRMLEINKRLGFQPYKINLRKRL